MSSSSKCKINTKIKKKILIAIILTMTIIYLCPEIILQWINDMYIKLNQIIGHKLIVAGKLIETISLRWYKVNNYGQTRQESEGQHLYTQKTRQKNEIVNSKELKQTWQIQIYTDCL